MYLKRLFRNQTEKTMHFCLIVFLLIVCCAIRVFYVNAAEISLDNKGESEEVVPAVIVGTSSDASRHYEMLRIRRANEDGILPVNSITDRYDLSEKEYNILTRIVEAEAGNLDKKSKILVANVILNRMKNDEFPDTVEEVVFQNVNGAVQFSPIADGRYYKVKVTESTKESVDRALAGEDYSEGALYFMERSMSSKDNVSWFDSCLTKVFKYQSHEFFK